MNKKLPLAVIILTCNEELNLENCLKNVSGRVEEIFVVDSYSTDATAQIADRYGVRFFEHAFENQARQFNWALDNLDIKSEWILRLDADEYLTEELWNELDEILPKAPKDVSGFYLKRRVYFMGRWIKHGGYYPTRILRLFRNGEARSEDREMDEHLVLLRGRAGYLQNDFIDDNKKDLTFWIDKHNQFASREVKEVIKSSKSKVEDPNLLIEGPAAQRRLVKSRYYKLPPFLRAFMYFLWRYFFRLGFLDGKEGLIFHFLQGCWYRFLIDAKLYEQQFKNQNVKIKI